jgi:hypothetical protein
MKIHSRLQELGINFDPDSIAVILAAHEEWLTETNQGREFVANRFCFDWCYGRADMKYEVVTNKLDEIVVNGDQVIFLKTCVVKGDFVPPHQVVEKPVEKKNCASCGQFLHCTRLVKDPHKGDMMEICNNCLSFNESNEIKSMSGGREECSRCPNQECSFHTEQDLSHLDEHTG